MDCMLNECDTELTHDNTRMMILDSQKECYSGTYCSNKCAITDLLKFTNFKNET